MRLIDADEFKKQIAGMAIVKNYPAEKANALCEIIDLQPTAYDVDKVVKKIENKMFSAELYGDEWNGQTVDNLLCFGDVHEIIKRGG